MNQDDAYLPRIDPAVVRKAFPREVVDRTNRLDARESPTRDHKGKHFLSLLGIRFDTCRLQQRDDGGAQHDGVSESFYSERVFGHAGNSSVIRVRAQSQNEVIER